MALKAQGCVQWERTIAVRNKVFDQLGRAGVLDDELSSDRMGVKMIICSEPEGFGLIDDWVG